MMLKPAILTKHNIGSDDAIRPDNCSRANFRSRIDNRSGMNLRVAHS